MAADSCCTRWPSTALVSTAPVDFSMAVSNFGMSFAHRSDGKMKAGSVCVEALRVLTTFGVLGVDREVRRLRPARDPARLEGSETTQSHQVRTRALIASHSGRRCTHTQGGGVPRTSTGSIPALRHFVYRAWLSSTLSYTPRDVKSSSATPAARSCLPDR